MATIYRHSYTPLSMYGNVVALLRDCIRRTGVHLDVGCGYGAIAEPVRDELGLDYIGFDLAADGLDSLSERGFENHQVDLSNPGQSEARILEVTGDRPIASLSFLDTLEHLVNGPATLKMLRRLAERWATPLVLSVPNIAHKDIALKLLSGRWDVTQAGLLDHTHVDCYSYGRLARLMAASGWREVEARDWLLEYSDQRFPGEAPTLDPTLPVGGLLRRLVDQANPYAIVNQFVRSYCIDQPEALNLWHDRAEPARPLVSILVVSRPGPENHLLLADNLIGQTNQDFELVFLRHPVAEDDATSVTTVVDELPAGIREKSVVVASPHRRPAAALNDALKKILGHYLVIFQADEAVGPHWLSTIAEMNARTPNSVLRVGPFEDETGSDNSGSAIFPFAPEACRWVGSYTIPGGAFRELGLRFDETMTYGAEVDFIAQAVMLCGVTTSDMVDVCWQPMAEAVLSVDERAALTAAHAHTVKKLNSHPLILPPGSAVVLRGLIGSDRAFRDTISTLEFSLATIREQLTATEGRAREFEQEAEPGRRLGELPMLRTFCNRYISPGIQVSSPHPDASNDTSPFLSVITRTTGARIRTLRDTLMTLAGQSSQDFELQLVVHAETDDKLSAVRSLVCEFPTTLQARINIIQCTRPSRSAPLNDAVGYARGRYVAVLDDDDFVFGHWVETFERLSREQPGAVLRAACTRQDFECAGEGHTWVPRSVSWFQMVWPSAYDAVDHLYANYSPFMCMAYPISVFRDLNFSWDETLSTTEDWQLATHIAMICGVVDTPEVTAIYRWWTDGESSSFAHPPAEWQANRERIIANLNDQPILLPKGSVTRICSLIDENSNMHAKAVGLTAELAALRAATAELAALRAATAELAALRAATAEREAMRDGTQRELDQLSASTSWRITAPARRIFALMPLGLRFYARRVVKLLYWLATPHRIRRRIAFLKARGATIPTHRA